MQELGRAQAEEREPAIEWQVPAPELVRREPHHLLVDGAVVEVGDTERLRPQTEQVPRDGRPDKQPRAARRGPVRCREARSQLLPLAPESPELPLLPVTGGCPGAPCT